MRGYSSKYLTFSGLFLTETVFLASNISKSVNMQGKRQIFWTSVDPENFSVGPKDNFVFQKGEGVGWGEGNTSFREYYYV